MGHGRVFFFSPGHEAFKIYEQKEVITIINNAVKWAHYQKNQKAHKSVAF